MIRKPPKSATRKVLVALDGSAAAALALPTARTIAGQLAAVVEAVHVAPEEVSEAELSSRLGLDQAEREDIGVRLLIGDPVDELLRAVGERRVAFVVLATHGHTVAAGGRLARVPEALAASATRPILLVRPEAAAALSHPPDPVKRMLLPFDGTAGIATALRPAVRLAATLGAAIDLLYVVHPGQARPSGARSITPPLYADQAYYEWPVWAGQVAAWLESCCGAVAEGVPIYVHVRAALARDQIAAAIAEFAAEQNDDAIALVRRPHPEPSPSPILRSVLNLTPCPVLLVAARPYAAGRRAHS